MILNKLCVTSVDQINLNVSIFNHCLKKFGPGLKKKLKKKKKRKRKIILYISLFFCEIFMLVHLLSRVPFFVIPWTAACQASLSFTLSQSLLKLTSTEFVMLSHHLIFCHRFLLLPSIFPGIMVFSNVLALHIR